MEGEDERSEDSRSFSKASIPKRIAIVIAGATVNIIFALIVYFILATMTSTYVSNQVDSVIENYAASEVGIQSGDIITKINDNDVRSKYDIDKALENNNGEEIKLEIERNGEKQELNLKPTKVDTKVTGIYLDDECKVVAMDKNSAAERQGIKTNDKIIEIEGVEIGEDTNKAIETISQNKEKESIKIRLERGEEEIEIDLISDTVPTYYLGINFKMAEDTLINRLINGGMVTRKFVISLVDNLKQLFTGNVGVDQMMGPVGISEMISKTDGIIEFLQMMALISLSLGVTNLLPIPALDGGKLLILIIESIRRKPMKEETEINIQLLGFAILITLSLYITYNDILRIF